MTRPPANIIPSLQLPRNTYTYQTGSDRCQLLTRAPTPAPALISPLQNLHQFRLSGHWQVTVRQRLSQVSVLQTEKKCSIKSQEYHSKILSCVIPLPVKKDVYTSLFCFPEPKQYLTKEKKTLCCSQFGTKHAPNTEIISTWPESALWF